MKFTSKALTWILISQLVVGPVVDQALATGGKSRAADSSNINPAKSPEEWLDTVGDALVALTPHCLEEKGRPDRELVATKNPDGSIVIKNDKNQEVTELQNLVALDRALVTTDDSGAEVPTGFNCVEELKRWGLVFENIRKSVDAADVSDDVAPGNRPVVSGDQKSCPTCNQVPDVLPQVPTELEQIAERGSPQPNEPPARKPPTGKSKDDTPSTRKNPPAPPADWQASAGVGEVPSLKADEVACELPGGGIVAKKKQTPLQEAASCTGDIACNVFRSAVDVATFGMGSVIANLAKTNNCFSKASSSNCFTTILVSAWKSAWKTLHGLFDLAVMGAKAIVDGTKWLAKKTMSLFGFGSVENETSNKGKELTKTEPGLLDQFKKDPIGFIWNGLKAMVNGYVDMSKEIIRDASCTKWSGAPFMSSCLSPSPWHCADCDQRMNAVCGVVGVLGGEVAATYVTGGAFKLAGAAGRGALRLTGATFRGVNTVLSRVPWYRAAANATRRVAARAGGKISTALKASTSAAGKSPVVQKAVQLARTGASKAGQGISSAAKGVQNTLKGIRGWQNSTSAIVKYPARIVMRPIEAAWDYLTVLNRAFTMDTAGMAFYGRRIGAQFIGEKGMNTASKLWNMSFTGKALNWAGKKVAQGGSRFGAALSGVGRVGSTIRGADKLDEASRVAVQNAEKHADEVLTAGRTAGGTPPSSYTVYDADVGKAFTFKKVGGKLEVEAATNAAADIAMMRNVNTKEHLLSRLDEMTDAQRVMVPDYLGTGETLELNRLVGANGTTKTWRISKAPVEFDPTIAGSRSPEEFVKALDSFEAQAIQRVKGTVPTQKQSETMVKLDREAERIFSDDLNRPLTANRNEVVFYDATEGVQYRYVKNQKGGYHREVLGKGPSKEAYVVVPDAKMTELKSVMNQANQKGQDRLIVTNYQNSGRNLELKRVTDPTTKKKVWEVNTETDDALYLLNHHSKRNELRSMLNIHGRGPNARYQTYTGDLKDPAYVQSISQPAARNLDVVLENVDDIKILKMKGQSAEDLVNDPKKLARVKAQLEKEFSKNGEKLEINVTRTPAGKSQIEIKLPKDC